MNPNDGIQLYPSDPLEAAKMRIKMVKFMSTLGGAFPMLMSRGTDVEKINAHKESSLPVWEQWATEANGKFLMGGDEITMLDIHCAPFWEMFYLMEKGTYANVDEVLKIRTNAPNWVAYVERFRNHPAIKPWRMNAKASENHAVRSRGWPADQKCQLSLDILEGGAVWPEDEE